MSVAIVYGLCAIPAAHTATAPTVPGELQRLAATGAVAPADAQADRAGYDAAKAELKRLTGTRRAELGGVVADLEGMAARGQLTASRLPALFLTLASNASWWSASPLLAAGQRVSLPGSELVWQYYPGHGIQIQWLGTFGTMNALWSGGKRYNARLATLLDEVLPLAADRAGGLAWEYLFPFDGQSPPWVSSLAQGTGLQALARAAVRLNRQADVFPVAARGLGIFQTAPPEGVRVPDGAGAHYLQYSGLPGVRILNGFVQSLVGLYDFATLTGDPTARALFDAGNVAARAEVPTYDTGAWSLYQRGTAKTESDLSYHKLLRDFLVQLCARTAEVAYCSAAQHFTSYLTLPPAVTVLPRTLRANRTGKLRFTLSKISHVSFKVSAGSRVIAAHDAGTLGRGTKTLLWKAPKTTGAFTLTVTATDLAGNPASATGALEVTRTG